MSTLSDGRCVDFTGAPFEGLEHLAGIARAQAVERDRTNSWALKSETLLHRSAQPVRHFLHLLWGGRGVGWTLPAGVALASPDGDRPQTRSDCRCRCRRPPISRNPKRCRLRFWLFDYVGVDDLGSSGRHGVRQLRERDSLWRITTALRGVRQPAWPCVPAHELPLSGLTAWLCATRKRTLLRPHLDELSRFRRLPCLLELEHCAFPREDAVFSCSIN